MLGDKFLEVGMVCSGRVEMYHVKGFELVKVLERR